MQVNTKTEVCVQSIELKVEQYLKEIAKRLYMSNTISFSHESNPSRRICNLPAAPLGHVADFATWQAGNRSAAHSSSVATCKTDAFSITLSWVKFRTQCNKNSSFVVVLVDRACFT